MVTIEQIAWVIERAERSTKTGSRPHRQQIIAQAIIDSVLPRVKAQAIRDMATNFIDWDVMYGIEETTPETEASHAAPTICGNKQPRSRREFDMYWVHTEIAGYPFVYTAKSLTEAKTVKQVLLNPGNALTIAYITDANGERI